MLLDPAACYRALLTRDARFDAASRAAYDRPPSSLRRAGGDGSAISLVLPFRPPYDWAAMIGFLAARAIPGVECATPGGYARTITLGDAHGCIIVRPAAPHEAAHALVATIRFPVLTALPAIVARIRGLFDLGADPAVIGAHLSADPKLAALVAARPGLRVPGAWDGFELAVRAILGQQITVAAASRLAGRLVAAYGTPLPAGEPAGAGLRALFPAPALLADPGLAARLGMPRSRAGAIAALAAAAVADPRLFATTLDPEAAVARLTALPGIGEWTAQYIALRALRAPDAFPAADIGLLRALATPAGRPTPREALARASVWHPWRAYAALHLWTANASPAAPTMEAAHGVPAL